MKKILFLLAAVLCSFTLKAQITFTAQPTPVYNGENILFTASGESNSAAVDLQLTPSPATNGVTMVTPNNQGLVGNFYLSNITVVRLYNPSNGAPSQFSAKVNTSSYAGDATVKFKLNVSFVSVSGNSTWSGTVEFQVNTKPGTRPTGTYYNTAQSGTFARNDCGTGYVGSSVSYSIAANQYSSTISQNDANQKAINALYSQGQAYANANGTCSVDYSNWITYHEIPRYSNTLPLNVVWNKNLVSTPTVKFEIYQYGVFKAVIATGVPNTGDASIEGAIDYLVEMGAFEKVKVKIISEADPSIFDFSTEEDFWID